MDDCTESKQILNKKNLIQSQLVDFKILNF